VNSENVYSAPWSRVFFMRSWQSLSWWTFTLLLCNEGFGLPLCAFFVWAFGACSCGLRSSWMWRPVIWWLVPVTQGLGVRSRGNETVYHHITHSPVYWKLSWGGRIQKLSHTFETLTCCSLLASPNLRVGPLSAAAWSVYVYSRLQVFWRNLQPAVMQCHRNSVAT
jgi:hypothetical protein